MQPTVQSQARLKRLAWTLGLLLALTIIVGGFYVAHLSTELYASRAALDTARRELIAARRMAEGAMHVRRAAIDKAQSAESLRLKLEAKLKAAEAARAEAEAKLQEVTEKQSDDSQ